MEIIVDLVTAVLWICISLLGIGFCAFMMVSIESWYGRDVKERKLFIPMFNSTNKEAQSMVRSFFVIGVISSFLGMAIFTPCLTSAVLGTIIYFFLCKIIFLLILVISRIYCWAVRGEQFWPRHIDK